MICMSNQGATMTATAQPTTAQLRALAAIRDGRIEVEYPSGAFLKMVPNIRIDTLYRALEAVRDGRVVIRSVPDPTSSGDGRYLVVETTRGPRVARAAFLSLYYAAFGIGGRIETPSGEWAWHAVLKPIGVALLAGVDPAGVEQFIADQENERYRWSDAEFSLRAKQDAAAEQEGS
jgi:hypothetical protein